MRKRVPGSLAPAHRGYAYQDLVAAYLLVVGLVEGCGEIIIDRKVVDDDRFDDIGLRTRAGTVRRQLKSSASGRCLATADFVAANSSLRLDRLLATFSEGGVGAATEYRLCATWLEPEVDDPLRGLLRVADADGTFPSHRTQLFRFDAELLWPPAGASKLESLNRNSGATREQFLEFCARFVIELGFPPAALDLEAPGVLESLLLQRLHEDVGIGRYPNDGRRLEDVAALAIYLANTARIDGASLTPAEIAQGLALRTDFGRIAQAFPLDHAVLQERPVVAEELATAVASGGVHLVLGGPGAGKSWQLTQLADALREIGTVVARHYCFLEPGDEMVERRVTTDALFGNLVAELHDELKRLDIDPRTRFSSGLAELEASFGAAREAGCRVVVIVDGLDHIARVRANQGSLSDSDTDIVEQLATLRLPEGVTLVIGSQPGSHLDPLREAFGGRLSQYELPAWAANEMAQFMRRVGVHAAMKMAAIESERIDSFEDLLATACEGNPLYGRYLAEELIAGLRAGAIDAPEAWLAGHPAIHGNIANYYAHLYAKIGTPAQPIAALLGLLDFSVTQRDLEQMLPLLAGWIPETLELLAPLLVSVAGQGGMRIFHESFRRFILDELRRGSKPAEPFLDAVIAWLDGREFFADARSYRFLLPALRRAGRHEEILRRVNGEFAARSLVHGHSEPAIHRNLDLAADVAALLGDWPAMMRLAELTRAVLSCFDPGSSDWDEYWRTYAALSGPDRLTERLIFEGRPTLSKDEGLACCDLADRAGATAPWREYMALSDPSADQMLGSSEFDVYAGMSAEDATNLAAIRGRIRLGGGFRLLRRVCEHLYRGSTLNFAFTRELGRILYQEFPPSLVRKLASRCAEDSYQVAPRESCALWLGLADAANEVDDAVLRAFHATRALAFATDAQQAIWCVELGAEAQAALPKARSLSEIDLSLGGHSIVRAEDVREWVASAAILGLNGRVESFAGERSRLAGNGWYRCWLRYVLALAETRFRVVAGEAADTEQVFGLLMEDLRPFAGQPRACDLYAIHAVIRESLAAGLALPTTRAAWERACECLTEAHHATATRLDREDGGPISSGGLIALLEAYVGSQLVGDIALSAIEEEVADQQRNGTYYATHAEYSMRLARCLMHAGFRERAHTAWTQACEYLLGYGFHKDIALFDLIECVPALRAHEGGRFALGALSRLQPLVSAVLRHTDHRETRHAPGAWLSALREVDPVRALVLLARTMMDDPGRDSWIATKGMEGCLRAVVRDADPLLTNALWETLFLECRHAGEAEEMVADRLAAIQRLASSHIALARTRFQRLCAEVQDDSRHHGLEGWPKLQEFAAVLGVQLGPPNRSSPSEDRSTRTSASAAMPPHLRHDGSAITASARFVDLLTAIRKLGEQRLSEDDVQRLVVMPLSYVITNLVERGEAFQARRLLSFLAHEARGWNFEPVHPISHLAKALDNAGHRELACIAYTLGYCVSRGGGGWLTFGGKRQTAELRRAIELDRTLAMRTLAEEAARKIQNGATTGLTRHLVQELVSAGEPQQAALAWEQAFLVMQRRLQDPGRVGWLALLAPEEPCNWTLDEALALLLLVRVGNPVLTRRSLALLGLATFIDNGGAHVLARPLADWLVRGSTVSSQHAVLGLLDLGSPMVGELVRALGDIFATAAGAHSWGIARLASRQLAHIGRPTPPRVGREAVDTAAVSNANLRRMHAADPCDMVSAVAEIWPDFPKVLAARLAPFDLSEGAQHEYHRERAELAFGRQARPVVEAPVLLWPTERFIAIFDEVLMGVDEVAWKRGAWSADLEDEILSILVPNLWLRVGVQATRIPRPAWSDLCSGARELRPPSRVDVTDPDFGGWIRVAVFEREFIAADGRTYSEPDSVTMRFGGLVCPDFDGTVPTRMHAMVDGSTSWWKASSDAGRVQRPFALAGMCIETDSLGREIALAPRPQLAHVLGLQPASFLKGFVWRDAADQPGLVGRTWRQAGGSIGGADEALRLIGMDILLRPDLLPKCEESFQARLQDLVEVSTSPVRE